MTKDLGISENDLDFCKEELCGRVNPLRKDKCSEEMTWQGKKTKNLAMHGSVEGASVLQRCPDLYSDPRNFSYELEMSYRD